MKILFIFPLPLWHQVGWSATAAVLGHCTEFGCWCASSWSTPTPALSSPSSPCPSRESGKLETGKTISNGISQGRNNSCKSPQITQADRICGRLGQPEPNSVDRACSYRAFLTFHGMICLTNQNNSPNVFVPCIILILSYFTIYSYIHSQTKTSPSLVLCRTHLQAAPTIASGVCWRSARICSSAATWRA